jgi:hypothetical protein
MKKSMVGLALCAALCALGLLSGCDATLSASGDGDGIFTEAGDDDKDSNKKGQLTITGISSASSLYETSCYVYITASSTSSPSSNHVANGSVTIDSSTVTVPLYSSGSPWTGTGSRYV